MQDEQKEIKFTIVDMFKNTKSYFLWIAILSAINSVLSFFNVGWVFFFSLNITQLGDAFIFANVSL